MHTQRGGVRTVLILNTRRHADESIPGLGAYKTQEKTVPMRLVKIQTGCANAGVLPFEIRRTVSRPLPESANPHFWSARMVDVAREHDRDSFMRIYDHFMPRVLRYLMGLGCAETVAEELTQEALLRVWNRAESYDAARSTLSTWLFRIARNLYIDRVRREPHWIEMQEGLDALDGEADPSIHHAHAPSPEAFAEHMDLQSKVEELPALQARLLRMSYYEAKTHQEIAVELGMPLGTVKSNLRRALLKLQIAIKAPR